MQDDFWRKLRDPDRYPRSVILLVNCIESESNRVGFDRVVVPRLAGLADGPVESVPLLSDEALPAPGDYDRLVLTGSELSAAKEHPRDAELIRTIRAFAEAGRPILGICYGHQMIARAFGGRCRRAALPEFGWKALEHRESPLFAGIPGLVSAHWHWDEVPEAPPGFNVLASTDRCAVQAMAAGGIFGIQFHPELTFERAERMFARNLASDPAVAEHYTNELSDPADAARNDRIFTNFFGDESRDAFRLLGDLPGRRGVTLSEGP